MFGKHFEAAEATVLFAQYHSTNTFLNYRIYEVILEVRTRDGQTFRTDMKQHFFRIPTVGDVVKVEYDPKSKQVKVVTKGDARYDEEAFLHAADLANKAKHDAILSAPAGTPLPGSFSRASQIDDPELIELVQLELAERNRIRDELLRSGSEGNGTILSVSESGMALSALVWYVVRVQVSPLYGGSSFERPVEVWLDSSKGTVAPGDSVRVRYDPQDPSRIVLQFAWE